MSHNQNMAEQNIDMVAATAYPDRWEEIKPDVFRIYIKEDHTLEMTIAAIQKSHGHQARYVSLSVAIQILTTI